MLEERAISLQAAMTSAQEKRIADLEAQLRRLRRQQAEFEKLMVDVVAKCFADFRKECGYLQFAGIWDEGADYVRGSMISCAGAMWIAVVEAPKGARPGKAPAWRLAAKSGDAK